MSRKQTSTLRRGRQRHHKKLRRARRRAQLAALGKLCLACKQEIGKTPTCRVCCVAKRLTAPPPRQPRATVAAMSQILKQVYYPAAQRLVQQETLLYSLFIDGQGQNIVGGGARPDGDRPTVTRTRTPDADDLARSGVRSEG